MLTLFDNPDQPSSTAAPVAPDRPARERIAEKYPLLRVGELVKTEISQLRFHWLKVLRDDGPASKGTRMIEVGRTEPERAFERFRARRDRVVTLASRGGRMSIYDTKPHTNSSEAG